MKNVLLLTAIVATGIGLELTSPAPEPKVVIPSPIVEKKTEMLCPVVGDGRTYTSSETTESSEPVREYIHCRKCETGALFPLEKDPTVGRCSYCHEEYSDAFHKE